MNQVKKWLRINASFSFLCGTLALIANKKLQELFGFENDLVLQILGVGLLVFAAFLICVSIKHATNKSLINSISLMDGMWFFGSFVLIVFQLFNLSTIGYVIIFLIAIFVGTFGFQQYRFNK